MPHKDQSLSVTNIKTTLARKGWTNRALAQRWNCTEEYVSKIIHDSERRKWFEDAVAGLPDFNSP